MSGGLLVVTNSCYSRITLHYEIIEDFAKKPSRGTKHRLNILTHCVTSCFILIISVPKRTFGII